MKIYSPALALGLIAPILTIHAESSNESPGRMQRLTRRNTVHLSSSNKAGSSSLGLSRRNATTSVPRQDKVDSTVSNSTTSASTIGDVVDKHFQQSESSHHGSPYLVANALRLFHEGIVLPVKKAQVVKRGEDYDQKMTSTSTASDDQDDEECEEEDDDDAEECDNDEDAEDCEDDGDEEHCDAEDDTTSPIGNSGNVSFVAIDTPANLAKGSLSGKDGCTKFATAVKGDSCYKLIGARDDELLKVFYKNNPSVDSGCQNLEVDAAYCVSATEATVSTPAEPSSSAAVASPSPSAPTDSKVEPVETKAESKPSPEPQQNNVIPSVKPDIKLEASVAQPKAPEPTQKQKSENDGKAAGKKADYTGTATFYFQNGNAGACGDKKSDSDFIVALTPSLYNNGARCGQKLSITNKATGKTVQAEVKDLCPTCADQSNNRHIDLSKGLFDAISNGADGTFQVEYGFI